MALRDLSKHERTAEIADALYGAEKVEETKKVEETEVVEDNSGKALRELPKSERIKKISEIIPEEQKKETNNWKAFADSINSGLINWVDDVSQSGVLGNKYIRKYTDPVYMLTKALFGTTLSDETGEYYAEKRKEVNEQMRMSNENADAWMREVNETVTEPAAEMIPTIVIALLTNGGSAAGQAAGKAATAAGKKTAAKIAGSALKKVVTDPSFYAYKGVVWHNSF